MLRSRSVKAKGSLLTRCVSWLLIVTALVSCSRPADQPIEGWPTRSVFTSVVDAGHIAGELTHLGGKPGAFTLTWSEAELTSYLGSMLSTGDKVTLWCQPGELYLIYQTLALNGHSLNVRMSPRLRDNQLQFDLDGVWFDNQLIGPWLCDILQSMLNDILVDSLGQYRLQEVTVDFKQLYIRGELD